MHLPVQTVQYLINLKTIMGGIGHVQAEARQLAARAALLSVRQIIMHVQMVRY
jgi:hypothetical protein